MADEQQAVETNAEDTFLRALGLEPDEGNPPPKEEPPAVATPPAEPPSPEPQPEDLDEAPPAAEPEHQPTQTELELVYNGQTLKVPLDEVKNLAQLGMLHRNKQEQYESQWGTVEKVLQQVQQQTAMQPEVMEAVAEAKMYEKALDSFKDINWVDLAANNAQEYLTKQAQYNSIKERADTSKQKAFELYQKSQQGAQQLTTAIVTREFEKATRTVPRWRNAEAFKKDGDMIREYMRDRGFQDAEIDRMVTSRELLMVYDAARYRALEKARSEKLKQVNQAPKVPKAQSSVPEDAQRLADTNYRQRLRAAKTESEKARVIEDRLAAKFGLK